MRSVVLILLAVGWATAWATVVALQAAEPNLIKLPWAQILVGAAIASWGGATATVGRYLTASYGEKPFRWRAEAMRDALVSITVGGGSYLGGAWYGLPPTLLGLVLLLAGYLGVQVLGAAADRLLALVKGDRAG